MVVGGVIMPVSWLTEWVSSLTYPHGPGGFLHVCLDLGDLGGAMVRGHCKVPTLDEICHPLSGATCFSKLNTMDGFWSIHLDENSSYLTTFNTHCGRYRFLHMPFDLRMSQDIFQMWMDQATDQLPGIVIIYDDICIFSCTPEEHDEHLLHLMETAKDHGIIFNSAKCYIRQPHIAFYGTVFTSQGMWLDPTKIQALQDLPTTDSQAKLQSFLGLINYLQPFKTSLSTKTTFLWEQLAEWTGIPLQMQHSSA